MKQPVIGKTAVSSQVAPATWARWCGLSVVGIALAGMLAFTWRQWPEPIVDFGRELYVPWQLMSGKVLYRDIAYFNGPLSPYFNSLVFRVLGVSLMALVTANIAVLIVIVLMFHRLLAGIADELSATVGCVAFVILLSSGQPGPVGNYNFITPYSHEMTHGLALSLGAILCLARFAENRKTIWIAANGALLGLVFLTKPEIFFAAMAASLLGIVLTLRDIEKRMIPAIIWFASTIAPLLVVFVLLAIPLGSLQALSAVLGGWRFALDPALVHLPFYQRVRGTFDLPATLRILPAMTIGYAIVFGLPAVTAVFIDRSRPKRGVWLALSLSIMILVLTLCRELILWEEVGRPLVVVAGACVVVTMGRLTRGISRIHARDSRIMICAVFSVFALLLLAKNVLHGQLYHYGFTLAAPALVLAIAAFVCWLPRWIDDREGRGDILRGAAIGAIVVTAFVYLAHMNDQRAIKKIAVGDGPDLFYAGPRGESVNAVVSILDQLPAQSTVAVIPEGAMINYLSRRRNSTPFVVLMPPEMIMFGQSRVLDGFQQHSPDYVVLLDWDVSEYGKKGFTIDYGKAIYDWIVADYRPLLQSNDPNLHWILMQHRARQ